MNADIFTTDRDERPRGILRQLAKPILIAGVICCGLLFAGMKWLRPEPAPKAKAKWHITRVELSNFQKPRDAAQKPKR